MTAPSREAIGEHYVRMPGGSSSDGSKETTSWNVQRAAIQAAAQIRELPAGQAIVIYGKDKPMRLDLVRQTAWQDTDTTATAAPRRLLRLHR